MRQQPLPAFVGRCKKLPPCSHSNREVKGAARSAAGAPSATRISPYCYADVRRDNPIVQRARVLAVLQYHPLSSINPGEPCIGDRRDTPPMVVRCGDLFDLPPFICVLPEFVCELHDCLVRRQARAPSMDHDSSFARPVLHRGLQPFLGLDLAAAHKGASIS